jgi:uncharacterized protein (TIGR02391 family)
MLDVLQWLERASRDASRLSEAEPPYISEHPFVRRNIHIAFPNVVQRLFDNGHYSQATFEAFKFLDNTVKRLSGMDKSGKALMMEALKEVSPLIQLTPLADETDRNEQEGFKFMFAGSMIAIRNPRGHEHDVADDIDTCLDHLGLASLLLRRLEQAGFAVQNI